MEFFADFKEIILYFRDAAESATAGASVILVATTLYSSTNLFYHMRRSGEDGRCQMISLTSAENVVFTLSPVSRTSS